MNIENLTATIEQPTRLGSHLVTRVSDGAVLYRPPATEAERMALYGPQGHVDAVKRGAAAMKSAGCACDAKSGRCACSNTKAVTARTIPRGASDVDDAAIHPALAGTEPVRFSEAHAAREAAHARALERFASEGAWGNVARFDAILNEELSRRA